MASTPGTTLRAAGLRPLNQPRPTEVQADHEGLPRCLRWRAGHSLSGPHEVDSVVQRWRVVDEWWRAQPVERDYFRLSLADGRGLTVFHDVCSDRWYRQTY